MFLEIQIFKHFKVYRRSEFQMTKDNEVTAPKSTVRVMCPPFEILEQMDTESSQKLRTRVGTTSNQRNP